MNKNIPAVLIEKQEFQRQQTINKVLHAIDYLSSQGMDLSIKNLMYCTGLSRSVFAKPHVQAVINEHYQDYEEAMLEEKKATRKKKDKKKSKDERIRRLTEENAVLQEECALLRARLFLLLQRQQE
jgi:thioredoxin-related protein